MRPIVIGECLRALAAKALLKATDTGELEQLHPLQLGGHAIKGIHTAIFTVRSWVNSMMTQGSILLKVDLRNAFNSIRRNECLKELAHRWPSLFPWCQWMLASESWLWWNEKQFLCKDGVQQGDPLAPVLFALTLHRAVETLDSIPDLRQLWYLDDGILFGSPQTILAAVECLEINFEKCQLYGHPYLTSQCMNYGN